MSTRIGLPLLLASALLAAPSPALAGELSAIEQQIVDHVDRHLDERLALLERATEINSGTMNFEGVRAVGEVFAAELDELGFETRWVDGASFGRAGHLVARRAGADGALGILLIGHLDTVFEPESPFQEYELVGDGREARGPGVIDMKGGIVVMLAALDALRAAGALDALYLTVVLTGDEEKAGDPLDAARGPLLEAAADAVIALGFEDGDGDPATAVVARRGSTSWLLEVEGTAAHSSQIFAPGVGAGAIFETARILEGFRRGLAGLEDLTYNPGVIVGGTESPFDPEGNRGSAFGKTNVVAEEAVVQGDLRAVSPEQLERARELMRAVVARSLPGTAARIRFEDGYPPMGAADGNLELLARYDEVSRDLGLGRVEPVDPRDAGAADISFVAAEVGMALDGLGLMGRGGHTVEETADLTTLASQAKRAAVLVHRLATRRDV